MATSFLKKTMVYLGLLDDEYDEYDEYEDRGQRGFSSVSSRVDTRVPEMDEPVGAAAGPGPGRAHPDPAP